MDNFIIIYMLRKLEELRFIWHEEVVIIFGIKGIL